MKRLELPTVETILIIGLAYVFLIFGGQKIMTPLVWIGWIPNWLEGFMGLTKLLWTNILGVIEVVLGLSLLVPKTRTIATWLVLAHLAAIVFITGFSQVGIRDTGLMIMAIALLRLRLKVSA